jgi:hypothetical protein
MHIAEELLRPQIVLVVAAPFGDSGQVIPIERI